MNFEINPSSLCSISTYHAWSIYEDIKVEDLTPEQVFKIIKGEDRCSTTGSEDHPEFNKLRNNLEELGFIKTERSWWNGDRVLKPFTLNDAKFTKGEKFPSGDAIRYSIAEKQKNKKYKAF